MSTLLRVLADIAAALGVTSIALAAGTLLVLRLAGTHRPGRHR